MNEFTSQYLKRREELSGRQSGFTPAVIPLPTFSNAVTFQQRTKERTPSAPEPERVSLFRNDLLSKVSEKRVPDLSTRLRIRSESDTMRAEDLTRERRDILGFNPAPTQEQRDRVAEIDREREALRQRSGQLREDARWAEYGQLRYRPDFYANSTRPRSTLDDTRRRAGGEAVDERYLVGLEHAGGVGSMEWIERARQLTDDELAMYNYLRNTEGQESADAYLDLMEEALNQRVGGKQAEDIANIENPLLRTAATGAYAVGSGLDQFRTGVQQLFTEEALPTTATQFGAAQVREDLADASPSIGGKPLVLPGGASLGQAAFDLVSSAANMAPGMNRTFLAEDWKNLIPRKCWYEAGDEAADLVDDQVEVDIQGYDIDGEVVRAARQNAQSAGVDHMIHFQQRPVRELSHPKKYGFIITNPPYGERIEEKKNLPELYRQFGEQFAALDSWSAYVITAYEDAEKYMGRKADKNRKIYNGMMKTYFYQFLGPKPPRRRQGE